METIRFTEPEGGWRNINPIYVKDIVIAPRKMSEDADWCVVVTLFDGGSISRTFPGRDKAEKFFDYVNNCVKSIR